MKPAAPVTRSRIGTHRTAKRARARRVGRARPLASIEAGEAGTHARPLEPRRRAGQEAGVVPVQRTLTEGAEPDERQLDTEEALVGVELVGETGLDDPAVAARDHADEVVALEEMRAGDLTGRHAGARDDGRVVQRVAREKGEAEIAAEPEIEAAVDLVDS